MAITRRTFVKGIMDKDTDERLVPDGTYRHAENILITESENSETGSVQNSFSNKLMTSFDFGMGNIETLGGFCDELEDKLYWFVKCDKGCYLMEYDNVNGITSAVLADERIGANRVLNLSSNHLITGLGKIISEDTSEDLFLWTDDNMQPCCINIERAKKWKANNYQFVKEDIYLIKKPPRFSPTLTPTYIPDLANNIEEKFLSYSYRYKFADGEYSALSTFANYSFVPKPFKLDYYTLDNTGMINAFNAVRIEFNTGESQVKEIQLCVKESNWNAIYIIETFNKDDEGWDNNMSQNYTFSSNKLYTVLPTKELFRTFDNVPLKAKALELIGNRVVFGNYLEGRDMLDDNGNKVIIDYSVSGINEPVTNDTEVTTIKSLHVMFITNAENTAFKKGNKLTFYLNIEGANNFEAYNASWYYVLPQDYANVVEVFADPFFTDFLPVMDNDFRINFKYENPPNTAYVIEVQPSLAYTLSFGIPSLYLTPVTFKDTLNGDALVVNDFHFFPDSAVFISSGLNSTSLKTNRDYEVGIVYEDDFNRKTTVFTSIYNTLYVAQKYSNFKNRIKVVLNHKPPVWADRYKIVVKAKPLEYQTVYVVRFYNENGFTWCKLEAENKDKVLVGDTLVVKKEALGLVINPIKVKVLAIEQKEKDFIVGDKDEAGTLILQEAGLYMKIRPDKFSMDFDDYDIFQENRTGSKSKGFPTTYLNLQQTDTVTNVTTDIPIPVGSSIYLRFSSTRNYDAGWKDNTYEYTHYATKDYATLRLWFEENITNRSLYGNVGNQNQNYQGNFQFVNATISSFGTIILDPAGKSLLLVTGTMAGDDAKFNERDGRISVEMVIRTSDGFYVFETLPKQADAEIYYESQNTFEIINGNHKGNLQDQDVTTFTPAIIDHDFFNCYSQGNGVESYRVKDGFNTNSLNIDLRPTSTSVEGYKAVRRYADLTYSEPFVESSNINGLNEFNLSTANYKELDKQYGSIQKLHSRENDILVLQEERASKVMFGKDALYSGDGAINVTSIPQVLGQNIPYLGESGIGKNPESFAMNNYQIFYANIRRGLVLRLSIDGITEIVKGMSDWFRDLSITHPSSKKLGGYDPYLNQYVLSVDDQATVVYELNCGNAIVKSNQTTTFVYHFNLNELLGVAVLNYNIMSGNATILAEYDGDEVVAANVTNSGSLQIPRTSLNADIITVTVIPVSPSVNYEITNVCPTGVAMKVVSVVLNDATDVGKTIVDRYKWGSSPFYSHNELFVNPPITRWTVQTGFEGQGSMPNRGAIVRLESFKDNMATAVFDKNQCNRLGYLISSTVYTEASISALLGSAIFPAVAEELNNDLHAIAFTFNKTADNEILYLIWDYTNRKPIALNDSFSLNSGTAITVNVLTNDTVLGTPTVSILTAPTHGTAIVNGNNTITYTNDGTIAQAQETRLYEYGILSLLTGNGLTQVQNVFTATEPITLNVAVGHNYTFTAEQPNFSLSVLPMINGLFVFDGTIRLNIGDVLSVGYEIFGEGTVDGGTSWFTFIDKVFHDAITYQVSNGTCSASATAYITIIFN